MLLYSAWLPLSILLISFYRFYSFHPDAMLWQPFSTNASEFLYLFLIALPSAVPVTIALRLIYRRTKITAFAVGAITVPLATFAGLVGGLLGPLGIFLYVQVAGLPAWIALGTLVLIGNIRNRKKV